LSSLLSHVRVLDLSRVLAGPWTGQLLADLGADVVKVERPGPGDDTRAWGPPFLKDTAGAETREAGYYLAANRGKRSITVNLDTPEGQQIVRDLARDADIILENYKVDTLARFGLAYEDIVKINPKVIYCSITGFGQTGPKRANLAYDFLIQAMGGLMSVTGERDDKPGGGPQKIGIPIIDLITGVYAATAVLAALASRAVTGKGEYIDLAMLDVQVNLLSNQAMNYLLADRTPKRTGNAHPNIQPQNVFQCRDGQIVLVVGNDGQFVKFCEVIGRPELAQDPRFAANASRVRHQEVLQPIIEAAFVQQDRAYWIDQLEEAQVPCGPINSIPEVFRDPQVLHREMVRHIPHPLAGSVPQVVSPFRFRNSELSLDKAPPLLGEHTDEVLGQLGLAPEKIQDLRARGVI
jgi:crotonobetainyl-CoA:carnitine CoA-transferase CaiB-like acyl-CoA transferase